MPAKLKRCVAHVKAQGKSEPAAFAICSTSTGIKRKKGGGWTKESVITFDQLCNRVLEKFEVPEEEPSDILSPEVKTGETAKTKNKYMVQSSIPMEGGEEKTFDTEEEAKDYACELNRAGKGKYSVIVVNKENEYKEVKEDSQIGRITFGPGREETARRMREHIAQSQGKQFGPTNLPPKPIQRVTRLEPRQQFHSDEVSGYEGIIMVPKANGRYVRYKDYEKLAERPDLEDRSFDIERTRQEQQTEGEID